MTNVTFTASLAATNSQGVFLIYLIVPPIVPTKTMAKEKTYKIRFSNWEWQRLEDEAKKRNVPVAQLIREGLAVVLKNNELQVS